MNIVILVAFLMVVDMTSLIASAQTPDLAQLQKMTSRFAPRP